MRFIKKILLQLTILTGAAAIFSKYFKMEAPDSIAVIGGSDGPTSVKVTTGIVEPVNFILPLALLLTATIGLHVVSCKKKIS